MTGSISQFQSQSTVQTNKHLREKHSSNITLYEVPGGGHSGLEHTSDAVLHNIHFVKDPDL